MSDSQPAYEHPAEQFKRLSEGLFGLAIQTLEEAGPGPDNLKPMLLPFSERSQEQGIDGPGELMTFASSSGQDALADAVAAIVEHAQTWVGYILVRHAVVRIDGNEQNAVLLEAWFYDSCLHVVRRYRADGDRVEWLEPPAMVNGSNPPHHLLTATRRVGIDGFALVHGLLKTLASASSDGLTGECREDWNNRVANLPVTNEETVVPSFTWADMARNVAHLDKYVSMNGPAMMFDQKMDVVCNQFEAMSKLGK